MKNDELQRLLELYEKGRLSPRQKAEVERMMDEFHTGSELELDRIGEDRLWKQIDARTSGRHRIRVPLAIAAAVFIACSLAATIFLLTSEAPGNKIILPDGSLVWLKDHATIDYAQGEVREVSLKGEALFEVAKDAARPFVIHCGRFTATALGTSFNIKSVNDRIELTVLTGKVRLAYSGDSAIVVSPRHEVIVETTRILTSRPIEREEEIEAVTRRTDYNMRFEDTRMRDVVKRIETKFDVSIEVENDELLNCMVSADFTDQSLEVTLSMISEVLGTSYSIDGSNVILSGTGCPR